MAAKWANYQRGGERKKEGKNKLWLPVGALFSGSFVTLLYSTSTVVTSMAVGAKGYLGFTKNSRGSGSKESGTSSGTFSLSPKMLCLNTNIRSHKQKLALCPYGSLPPWLPYHYPLESEGRTPHP